MADRLNVYSRDDLRRVLAPHSIAVVGASGTPGSLGYRTLRNLKHFAGRVHYVNPRHTDIDGHPCCESIAALPEAPDCVVLCTPREAIEPAVVDCARRGAGGVVVFASGYAETGLRERMLDQQRLSSIAHDANMRIIGPNCTGIANHALGAHAAFAEFPAGKVTTAAIGLVTQSGALGLALSQAAEHGTSFSHVLTCGNSCDVDVADFINYLAGDPACKAIACQFEGLSRPERLFEAAAAVRRAGKTLVVFKIATGASGAEAAVLHTATPTGETAFYREGLLREGAVFAGRFESLVETAAFFAKVGRPSANGVAALSSTGGGAIMVADQAEDFGIALPQPSQKTLAVLRDHIPEFGAARNPCDATAQGTRNPDSLRHCAAALLDDPAYGALVIPLSRAHNVPLMLDIAALGKDAGKPVGIVWLSQWLEGHGIAEFEACPDLFVFRSMQSCFAAIAAWQARWRSAP